MAYDLIVTGAAVGGLLLGIYNSYVAHKKNRIDLNIELASYKFITNPQSEEIQGYELDYPFSKIEIYAEIKNTGMQPTTISKAVLFSDNDKFTNIELTNEVKRLSNGHVYDYYFETIRISSNDIVNVKLFASVPHYLENFKLMDCTIKFSASHKQIEKSLTVVEQW